MRRTLAWLYLAVLLMLLSAAAIWLYHSPYLPIRRIDIEGDLVRSDRGELRRLAQKHIRGGILKADLNSAQEAFSRLPWIAKAQVRRRLPDTVEIILVERKPAARWRDGRLLDSEGNLFSARLDEKTGLPLFEGWDDEGKIMLSRWRDFQKELRPLGLNVKKLTYTARASWELELDNGITVRLGRGDEIERIKRFAAVWPDTLRPQAGRLAYIDMRYSDGFAVRAKTRDQNEAEPEAGPLEGTE